MKKTLLVLSIAHLVISAGIAQPENNPRSADEVLASAKKLAADQNKNIFLMWHASWCGWCHRMDTLMNDAEIKEYFDDNFVVEHLVVKEAKDKKDLENPGGLEMLTKYNGHTAGIPFWVVLDKNGNLLMDSFMEPGKNTGCPARQNEVDYWIKVLGKTSKISADGLDKIAEKFLMK